LPHATDTRTVRFLFLPTEHDPDSYIRERGAEAFEGCIAQSVPLSRQLADAASEGCDLTAAEGRARMLANAKPLWSALPDGALKRQVIAQLATLGGLDVADLHSLWDSAAPPRPARDAAPRRVAQRAAGRVSRGTANLLDRALWLLIQRSDLWSTLDGESHDILAGQAAPYDLFFGCLERSVSEHGPLAPAALLGELRAQAERDAGGAVISRIAEFHDPDPASDPARELELVLMRLRLQAVEDELKLLFDSGALSPDAQQRGRQLSDARARLKAQLAKSSSPL